MVMMPGLRVLPEEPLNVHLYSKTPGKSKYSFCILLENCLQSKRKTELWKLMNHRCVTHTHTHTENYIRLYHVTFDRYVNL